MFDYEGRLFRPTDGAEATIARYHQDGDLVWAEIVGGQVRRGTMTGTRDPDGALHFGYSMVLDNGQLIVGSCRSLPAVLNDGRIRLTEHWERYGPQAATGISYIEEIPAPV
jgi:hypothetical protein